MGGVTVGGKEAQGERGEAPILGSPVHTSTRVFPLLTSESQFSPQKLFI